MSSSDSILKHKKYDILLCLEIYLFFKQNSTP